MSAKPMMKCGCAAQAVRIQKDGSRIPSCIVHDCIDIAESAPDLTGRKARCAYYGRSTGRNNECNYGQSNSKQCTCEQSSSADLPFFEYHGSDATDKFYCGCMGWD